MLDTRRAAPRCAEKRVDNLCPQLVVYSEVGCGDVRKNLFERCTIEHLLEQLLNFGELSARLLGKRPCIPCRPGRDHLRIRSPGAKFSQAARRAPERIVRAQNLHRREDDLLHGLAQRGPDASTRRGGPPDLTDAEVLGDRFGAQPQIDSEPPGFVVPDILIEAM